MSGIVLRVEVKVIVLPDPGGPHRMRGFLEAIQAVRTSMWRTVSVVVMTTLSLIWNEIGDEGAKAIAEALKVNTVLTRLRLGENKIGDEGAKAIAEALKVHAVLTELHLGYNEIGDAGKTAVQDAVKDLSGFVLDL